MIKRLLLVLISLVLLGGLLYFSDIGKIAEITSSANINYIALGLMLWAFALVLRTLRWKMLLKRAGISPNFFDIMKVFVAGMFISNITPGKLGDPVRSVILKKRCGYSVGNSLSSVFIERIFDVIATVFISVMGILFLSGISRISLWVSGAILFYLVAIGFGIFLISSESRTKRFFSKFFSVFSFISKIKKLENRINKFSKDLHKSFVMYNDKKLLFATLLLSFAIWIIEGIILFVSFSSINIQIPVFAAIVIVPVTSLIAILTFLPGGLGSGEIISVFLFTSLFNIELAAITSAILIGRLLSFWMYVVIGSLTASLMKYKFRV